MANPFLRRATEYIREDESFLSIVSPAPLTTFLATSQNQDDMFEVPVRIIGAPGSGKTMLATLAEFRMVETILRDEANATNRTLADALAQAGFLKDGKPNVAAVRVPMESEYRDFWELPYDPSVKTKLAFWFVQARAMLGLIRNLTANRTRGIDAIEFIPRANYEAHLEQIGGLSAVGIRDRALAVQRAIYSVSAGLRAPKLEDLPVDATAPYAPFDAISQIRIEWNGDTIEMSPLVMLDDVHALHHDQLEAMFGMLSHREMKFGRWMMMRLDAFVADYFADASRRVLLVAAAGFDPRSRRISQMLAGTLGNRLSAVFIREERPRASEALIRQADENEIALKAIIPDCNIFRVDVFADDGAPVGGSRIVSLLGQHPVADEVTDVILDLSALSIGIGFPAARMLLEDCEAASNRAFHLMIVSNPEMDDKISSVPSSRAGSVKGFSPPVDAEGQGLAQVWIPQLARGRASALTQIGAAIQRRYKICPLLPFPARNPRRADDLLAEYRTELVNEWEVDPRDVVYASERNPLDCYRTLSMLKTRFDRTMKGTYEPRLVLSPVGSKVLAAGALMAALEHDMAVQYLETESYLFDHPEPTPADLPDMTVHLILSGPLYASYDKAASPA